MNKATLLAPKALRRADAPVVADILDHICPRAGGNDSEYVRADGHWYLVTWAQSARQGVRTTWLVQARPAVASHCCAQPLDADTPALPYRGGIPQVDDAIAALRTGKGK